MGRLSITLKTGNEKGKKKMTLMFQKDATLLQLHGSRRRRPHRQFGTRQGRSETWKCELWQLRYNR